MHRKLVYWSSCFPYESSGNVMFSQNPFRLTFSNWFWCWLKMLRHLKTMALSSNLNASGHHLEFIKCWSCGPLGIHTKQLTLLCTRRSHLGWLTLIHCDSRFFLHVNHDWNDICIASRVGLVVLMLCTWVFTQWNALTETIHVDSHWFIVIQDAF